MRRQMSSEQVNYGLMWLDEAVFEHLDDVGSDPRFAFAATTTGAVVSIETESAFWAVDVPKNGVPKSLAVRIVQ